jgi:hypothetical protein
MMPKAESSTRPGFSGINRREAIVSTLATTVALAARPAALRAMTSRSSVSDGLEPLLVISRQPGGNGDD